MDILRYFIKKSFKDQTTTPTDLGLDPTSDELPSIFNNLLPPIHGQEAELFFQNVESILKTKSVQISSPRYMGHMTGPLPEFAPRIDHLIAELNQNLIKTETASLATVIERQVLVWLHYLIYKQSESHYRKMIDESANSLGNITTGGTIGNLTALLVAREKSLPGALELGISQALEDANYSDCFILASEMMHYSIIKAAAIMGIGQNNVIPLPVARDSFQIDVAALLRIIRDINNKKGKIIALIGLAGATETGSIDDITILAKIATDNNLWLHVDAAWGGVLQFSSKWQHKLKGIEHADSVVIDAHKGFYTAVTCGAVLFKEAETRPHINFSANYVIREGSQDLGRNSIEGSRRFDSLKLWITWNILGSTGLSTLTDKMIERCQEFGDLIAMHPCFQITSKPEAGIITYRYYIDDLPNFPPLEIQYLLDQLNDTIHAQLPATKGFFISKTKLAINDDLSIKEKATVLRAVFLNPFIDRNIMIKSLMAQAEIGAECRKRLLYP
jgi:glutamate decarboxylase